MIDYNILTREQLIALCKHYQHEAYLGKIDPLTSTLNRRGANYEFKRLQKTNQLKNKKLVFIDIDHFKSINDVHGHEFGDFALKTISHKLKEYFKDDIIIRFGGDEFLIITDKDTDYINKFNYVFSKIYNFKDIEIPISSSIGITNYEEGLDLDSWINLADREMYINKRLKKA